MTDERVQWESRLARVRRAVKFAASLFDVLALSVAVSTAAGAQSNVRVENDTREYIVGPPSNFPEGVVYDQKTKAFYGGSASDGTLYKQTLDAPPD